MKLSIVIPVYNTEAWLRKCLDSLLPKGTKDSGTDSGQTPELELVCVNDGSTDGSAAILREYAERYPTLITVILMLGGIQLLCLGIMGEYLGRIFNETKRRPVYLIGETNIEKA